MKIAVMTTIWTAIVITAQAKNRVDTQVPVVTVYVQLALASLQNIPVQAEEIASQILAQAGVAIRWRPGKPKADREKQPVSIEITSETPATLNPGALAYAEVHGGSSHIRIFWDRVNETGGSDLGCALLGHVLAHEITHILQGADHHSVTGVMKAHWTPGDIEQMDKKPLAFDPLDIFLIHQNLADYVQPPRPL